MMRVNVLITFDFRSSQSHNVAERRHRLLIIGRREKNINQAALHVTLLPSSLKGTLLRIVTELVEMGTFPSSTNTRKKIGQLHGNIEFVVFFVSCCWGCKWVKFEQKKRTARLGRVLLVFIDFYLVRRRASGLSLGEGCRNTLLIENFQVALSR